MYHISTGLILDNYKKQGECPLCDIYKEVELRLLEQFAGEAVMIDDFRDRVNKKGFCKKHFSMLCQGENKLGIALQTNTRMQNLRVKPIKSVKEATKESEGILKQLSTCAICDLIEDAMQRYYETIAAMFKKEDSFKRMLSTSKGHCLYHYAKLLENSRHAGGEAESFLKQLHKLQEENTSRLLGELDWFCDKFDYRNREKPMGTSVDALPRSIGKIHGNF